MKERGEKITMLTAYDMYTAATFDEAGIDLLLVGDSASNNVFGNETSLPVTVDELLPLTRAVAALGQARDGRRRPALRQLPGLARAGLPHRRPLHEGGRRARDQARGRRRDGARHREVHAGRHPGHGAHRLHARSPSTPSAATASRAAATPATGSSPTRAPSRRRARSPSSWRWCPATSREQISKELTIPTIGIGAGAGCDGQVLVWQDAFGLRTGRMARFVKQYADVHGVLLDAARAYADDVRGGTFPGADHTF